MMPLPYRDATAPPPCSRRRRRSYFCRLFHADSLRRTTPCPPERLMRLPLMVSYSHATRYHYYMSLPPQHHAIARAFAETVPARPRRVEWPDTPRRADVRLPAAAQQVSRCFNPPPPVRERCLRRHRDAHEAVQTAQCVRQTRRGVRTINAGKHMCAAEEATNTAEIMPAKNAVTQRDAACAAASQRTQSAPPR